MAIFLILLYVLEANGAVIPIGCFVAAWVMLFVKAFLSFIKFAVESRKDK